MVANKRIIALLLVLMMLTANISFAEEAFQKKQYKLPDDIAETAYMSNIVYINDTFYVLVDMKDIYSLKKGEEVFSFYAKDTSEIGLDYSKQISNLYTDGEKLYAFCAQSGDFFEVGEKDGEVVRNNLVKFDLENYKETYDDDSGRERSYYNAPQDSILYNGQLYAIYREMENPGTTLSSFDISTGEETVYGVENVKAMSPYKDGKLILVIQNEEKLYASDKPEEGAAKLFIFDPATDSTEEIGLVAIEEKPRYFYGAIFYDENRDAVMYFTDSGLMLRHEDASAEKCAHFASSFSVGASSSYTRLPGNYIALIIQNTVYVESTDPASLPKKSLVVYNGYSNNHDYAVKQMLDTAITMHEGSWFSNAQELGQALVSGSNNIDIFALGGNYMDTNSIINKGYALELSGAKGVSEFVDSLYPYIKDACVRDGKIYALPVYLYHHTYSQNNMLLEELNISSPKTFGDVCDILSDWYSDEDRASEYNFTEDPNVKYVMWDMLFNLYANHVYLSGEEMRFDTPVFRSMADKLMKALENVPDISDSEMQYDEEYYQKPTLFGMQSLDIYQMSNEAENRRRIELLKEHPAFADDESYKKSDGYSYPFDAMVLKATETSPEGFSMELTLVFVNSKTHDPENALRYIENFIQGYMDETKISLCKDYAEPKLNQYYEKGVENQKDYVESLKKEIEKAEGAEKTELEKDLARAEVIYQLFLEGRGKYQYTQEGIEEYKSYLNNVYISTYDNSLFSRQEQILTLRQRLIEGQMNLDAFIKEADAKLKLIKLENQ